MKYCPITNGGAFALIASGTEGVLDEAKYLLEDKEGWWLKYKMQSDAK